MMSICSDLEDLKSCIHGRCSSCRFTYGEKKCMDYQLDIIDDAIQILDKQKSIIEDYIRKENKSKHDNRKEV